MAFCSYCGAALPVDDEIQKVQLDGAEKAGYEFEKGRQRAQAEAAQASSQPQQACYQPASQSTFQPQVPPQSQQAPQEPPKRRKTWLWVLGWICIFPVPLTIIMLNKKDMSKKLGTASLPQVGFSICSSGLVAVDRSKRRGQPAFCARSLHLAKGAAFAWADCSRTRKLQAPAHSITDSSLMIYPFKLHFVLDGGTFPEKRSPALVCWSRIARERTAIQSVFPLERDGV